MRLLTILAQVPRRSPMKRLVHQETDLKLDAKRNWEPVQNITEERCNVIIFSPIAHQPSSGIKHRLQAIQETLRRSDKQTVAAINLRCDEGCNCRSRCLKRQRFDVAFQETKLTEAAADGPGHVVFHCQIGLKHNSKVTNNGHRANQRTADAQLPGVKIRAPSTSHAPKKLRLLGIKTKSVRPHPQIVFGRAESRYVHRHWRPSLVNFVLSSDPIANYLSSDVQPTFMAFPRSSGIHIHHFLLLSPTFLFLPSNHTCIPSIHSFHPSTLPSTHPHIHQPTHQSIHPSIHSSGYTET